MKRAARLSPGRRGRPWRKSPTSVSPYPGRDAHRRELRARLKTLVDGEADAAALIQIVRDCHEEQLPVPAWVPVALEQLLTDFVNLATAKRGGPWTRWARHWRRRFLDRTIATHLMDSRDVYGLTWEEAAEEAADWFAGTPAAGGPAAMLAAYKRDRKLDGRPPTQWELAVTAGIPFTARPFRPNGWWATHSDQMGDERGVWKTRPRRARKE